MSEKIEEAKEAYDELYSKILQETPDKTLELLPGENLTYSVLCRFITEEIDNPKGTYYNHSDVRAFFEKRKKSYLSV